MHNTSIGVKTVADLESVRLNGVDPVRYRAVQVGSNFGHIGSFDYVSHLFDRSQQHFSVILRHNYRLVGVWV